MIWMVIIGSIVFLTIIMFGTIVFMKIFLDLAIGKKHKDLETILDTRDIPERWKKNARGSLSASRIQRRLEKLEKYVRSTSLVDNEETRSFLLRELAEIKEEWIGRHVDKLAGHGKKNSILL